MTAEDFLSADEKRAVRMVLKAGKEWGYGNLIIRLKCAWALHLKAGYPEMSWEAACLGAWMDEDAAKHYSKMAQTSEIFVVQSLRSRAGLPKED